MQKNAHKTRAGLLLMAVLALGAAALYMLVNVDFENEKLFAYAMRIRAPKLFAMMITAFAIGGASLVFQSVINNTIVTPCLLGMNSLYMLIHTAVIFAAGSGSILAVNAKAAFGVDLLIMGTAATVIYSTLFRKTGHNVLYVLLIGTVLNSFFGSVQSALTRIMDPNEYDSLLADLVASFANVNSEIMLIAALVLALVVFALRKELALLDVITLGKDQAVNLGVDYDRCIRRLLLGVALFIAVATAMVRTGFLFRTDSCESFPSASKDLPPQPVDFRLRIFWDHHPGGRAADRGAGIYLYSTGKCFYYIFWRHLFSISAAY